MVCLTSSTGDDAQLLESVISRQVKQKVVLVRESILAMVK